MDIGSFLNSIAYIGILGFFIWGSFNLVAFLYIRFGQKPLSLTPLLIDIPISLLFSLIFDKVVNFLKSRRFFGQLEEITELHSRVSDITSRTLDLDRMSKKLIKVFTSTMNLKYTYLHIRLKETDETFNFSDNPDIHINLQKDILPYLEKRERIFKTTQELRINFLKEKKDLNSPEGTKLTKFKRNKIGIVVREKTINGNLLILILGSKEDLDPFSNKEIEIVNQIIPLLSTAIDRGSLYVKSQNFNRTLQRKVDEATSELQERNEELQDLYNNLEELYQKEKDLMDIAGHELRTPASILKNNLFLLKNRLRQVCPDQMKDEKLQKYITRLKDSTDRQIRLVNTFLESARMENNKFKLNLEHIDIADLVNVAIEEVTPFAERKDLEVIYEPITKKIHVDIDPTRMREVFDNLLNNAVKYTKEGYIKVDLQDNKEEDTVTFSVKDSGIGISKEDQKFLFKKFSRIQNHIGDDDENLVRPGGTGLGLYVSKNIVEEHGGTIGVESEKGKGSTFHFTIPKSHELSEMSESPFEKFKKYSAKTH
jgi:signal transduction histidine kinase